MHIDETISQMQVNEKTVINLNILTGDNAGMVENQQFADCHSKLKVSLGLQGGHEESDSMTSLDGIILANGAWCQDRLLAGGACWILGRIGRGIFLKLFMPPVC